MSNKLLVFACFSAYSYFKTIFWGGCIAIGLGGVLLAPTLALAQNDLAGSAVIKPGAGVDSNSSSSAETSTASGQQEQVKQVVRKGKVYSELTWDDLMPVGWEPPMAPYFDEFSDPVKHSQQGLELQIPAPVVEGLAGKNVRLAGYVIPIKVSAEEVTEFLLVPYVGACIHVPPPPENQIVYVTLDKSLGVSDLWAPVWVNGTMALDKAQTQYATTGYHLKGASAEVYVYEAP